MQSVITGLPELSILEITIRLLLSTVYAGTLGYERERHKQAAGFRTYIIVADASALVMMTNIYIGQCVGTTDLVRMPASVITGLGFLGAGTILVTKSQEIRGLTTAAGLWAVANIGLALGAGFYTGGTICYVFILVAMNILRLVDQRIGKDRKTAEVYCEMHTTQAIGDLIRYGRSHGYTISDFSLYNEPACGREHAPLCGTFMLRVSGKTTPDEAAAALEKIDGVLYLTLL